MYMTIDMFVMEVAILEKDLFDQSAFDEQRNSSVNRSLGDNLFLVSHAEKKLIHIEVVMGRKNLFNDYLPFRSVSEPFSLDVIPEFLDFIHNLVKSIIIETQSQ